MRWKNLIKGRKGLKTLRRAMVVKSEKLAQMAYGWNEILWFGAYSVLLSCQCQCRLIAVKSILFSAWGVAGLTLWIGYGLDEFKAGWPEEKSIRRWVLRQWINGGRQFCRWRDADENYLRMKYWALAMG